MVYFYIMKIKDDIYFMNEALKEAKKCLLIDEVPVGAVIVRDNKIIARAHNTREKNKDVTCHAEINALRKANKKDKNTIEFKDGNTTIKV